jgi:hypothetical protein
MEHKKSQVLEGHPRNEPKASFTRAYTLFDIFRDSIEQLIVEILIA